MKFPPDAKWRDVAQLLDDAGSEVLYLDDFAEWYDDLPEEHRAKVGFGFLWKVVLEPTLLFKGAKNVVHLGDKVWEAKIGKHGEALRVYYQRERRESQLPPRARLLCGSSNKSEQSRRIARAKELAQRPFDA